MNIPIGRGQFSILLIFGTSLNKNQSQLYLISFHLFIIQRWDARSFKRCTSCGTCGVDCWFTFRRSSKLVPLRVWLSDKIRRLSAGNKRWAEINDSCLFALHPLTSVGGVVWWERNGAQKKPNIEWKRFAFCVSWFCVKWKGKSLSLIFRETRQMAGAHRLEKLYQSFTFRTWTNKLFRPFSHLFWIFNVLNLCPRLVLLFEEKLFIEKALRGKVFFQSIKYTSEHRKYDEFMCIMYEAITGEKREMCANKQAEGKQDKFCRFVYRRWSLTCVD